MMSKASPDFYADDSRPPFGSRFRALAAKISSHHVTAAAFDGQQWTCTNGTAHRSPQSATPPSHPTAGIITDDKLRASRRHHVSCITRVSSKL